MQNKKLNKNQSQQQPIMNNNQMEQQTMTTENQVFLAGNNPAEQAKENINLDFLKNAQFPEEQTAFTGEQPQAQNGGALENRIMSREQFYTSFAGMFGFASVITGLESLDIDTKEEEKALLASNAIYDIALETPILNFLLDTRGGWVQRALCIWAFAGGKIRAVKVEIAIKKAEKAKNPSNEVGKEEVNNQTINQ